MALSQGPPIPGVPQVAPTWLRLQGAAPGRRAARWLALAGSLAGWGFRLDFGWLGFVDFGLLSAIQAFHWICLDLDFHFRLISILILILHV